MKNSNRLSKYKRMGKRILSMFMIFCMGLTVLPQGTLSLVAEAASFSDASAMPLADTHDHSGWQEWTDPTSLPPSSSGSYYLTTDVTINQTWIPKGNITLCLNGHTITHSGSDYDTNAAISVNTNRVFNIYDCQGKGAVKTSDRNCIHIAGYGKANIYGGIFNSDDNTHPAIVVVGTVTIENASVYGPGAVNIQSYGTANIYGGTFETTVSEPTIRAQADASLNITGGTFIRDNGGNIIQNQGTLEISGGTVTGKSSSSNGAVGIVNSGTSATATIKNVTITTKGTYIDDVDDDTLAIKADKGLRNDNGGTMTVENCDINSSNWAVWNTGVSTIQISGGTFNGQYGIYNNNGKFKLSGSPTFTGSIADIYLSSNQKITVAGALGNSAPYSVLTATDPAVGRPVEITDSSETSYNVAARFTAVGDSYIVRKNSSSQLELAVPATYTITYNAGSYGSGSVSSGTKTEGVDFTLSSETFTRTGYTQTGWSTTDDGAKEYDLGGTYSVDDDITLYPYWTANEYDITYKDQGGAAFSGTHENGYPTKHTYGTATTLKSATKTGYTFEGWYADSICTGSAVTSLGATDYTLGITLYAKWTANEYSITYMDQGGATFSGTHESGYPTKHTYGTATPLASASKNGYTFEGWYTDSICTNKVTSLGATSYTSDITLYAKWTVRGNVEVKTESGENAPDVDLPMEKEELEKIVLTEQEHKELDEGKDIKISLIVKDASNTVSEEVKQEVEKGASYYTIGQYLDISLIKIVTVNGGEGEASPIHNISGPIRIVITIPEELKGEKDRDYAIVRLHEGVTTLLEDLENPDNPDTITIETDRFSTYAMVYTELTDEDRVAGAKEKLPEILDNVIVTNDTTRESLEKQLQEAMNEAGFSDVKVMVGEDFNKDLATTGKEGKVTATVTVSKGDASRDTDFDKNIEKLSEVEPSPEPTPDTTPTPDVPSATPGTETTTSDVTIPSEQQEKNSIAMMAGFKVSQTGEKISIKWGKVKGADGYQVYVAYCGKAFTGEPVKTVKSASITKVNVTKLDGKKLNLKKNYKVYITAYKEVNGKKVVMGKTATGHIVGKNNKAYTNVKEIKVSKSKYTLQVGKTAKIKAKTVLVDKTKKQLSDAHAKEFRYKSTDTSVAVVSEKGKITAKGKGTCIIYVYARNGYAKKVKVTVK